MKSFLWALKPTLFGAVALFGAGVAHAGFLDVEVDILGGVHSVDIEVCESDTNFGTGDPVTMFSECDSWGFSLSFSGTPDDLGPEPQPSLYEDFLGSNLDTFEFVVQNTGLPGSPFSSNDALFVDIFSLVWLVDGNGGELSTLELSLEWELTDPDPEASLVVDVFPVFDDIFVDGVFREALVQIDLEYDYICLDPDQVDNQECFDDDASDYVDFFDDAPIGVPNTAEVPVPAPLALMGIGLVLLRLRGRA